MNKLYDVVKPTVNKDKRKIKFYRDQTNPTEFNLLLGLKTYFCAEKQTIRNLRSNKLF